MPAGFEAKSHMQKLGVLLDPNLSFRYEDYNKLIDNHSAHRENVKCHHWLCTNLTTSLDLNRGAPRGHADSSNAAMVPEYVAPSRDKRIPLNLTGGS